jgi:hypothetical protein
VSVVQLTIYIEEGIGIWNNSVRILVICLFNLDPFKVGSLVNCLW